MKKKKSNKSTKMALTKVCRPHLVLDSVGTRSLLQMQDDGKKKEKTPGKTGRWKMMLCGDTVSAVTLLAYYQTCTVLFSAPS